MTTDLRVWSGRVVERMRVLIVAGITTGALVVGIGSRLAMLLLRVTSSERVIGLQSDDDFTIGRFTLAGTYNLVVIGSVVGLIGFAVYRLVKPWLIGPHWFRRLTLGIASGIVVGSMLIHSNGIDFNVLKPKWLAIGLFIVLPALFAIAIGVVVDSVDQPNSWTVKGHRQWLLPILLIACVPTILFPLAIALVPVGIWALAGDVDLYAESQSVRWLTNVVRSGWMLIVLLGSWALISDVTALI